MDEMHFIYEKENVTIETLIRLGNKKEDILNLGYDTGNNKTFKLDGYTYKVVLPHGNKKEVRKNPLIPNQKPKAKRWEKVETKSTGLNNRKLYISNVVMYECNNNCGTYPYIDGKFISKEDLASLLGCSITLVRQSLQKVKSITMNDYNIKILVPTNIFKLKKDSVIYEGLTMKECIDKTGLTYSIIQHLERTGHYSKEQGWQVIDKKIVIL